MGQLDFFPTDYSQSRKSFRALAQQLRWEMKSYPISHPGPGAEELTIDVAMNSDAPLPATLVISSGVHGVEGPLGAAVQAAIMNEILSGGLPSIGYLFLHAVNPYGFAASRRFDENNVDPNRNFLVEPERYEGCPEGYRSLDRFLNPPSPPSRWEPFAIKALLHIARHGMSALQSAIAAGQYEFPSGIFFGGHSPSESHLILQSQMPAWLRQAERVVHLDFHTGLGRWGTWKLLIDQPLSDAQLNFLTTNFGPDAVVPLESDDADYQPRGGFGNWCPAQGFAEDYLFACAEVGTYHPLRVLGGLRAENRAHHWSDSVEQIQRAKASLRELFCPASDSWRSQALSNGCQLVRRAARALAAS